MNRKRKYISNKLLKTDILLRDKRMLKYVPQTFRLTYGRLLQMLREYGMVYIKPVTGSLGIGVMRVEKTGGIYRFKIDTREFRFTSFRKMYRSIRSNTGGKTYLVQRGIEMLKIKERPFDFRVMIQKNTEGDWETTGTAGRVAHPKKAVTNGSQGGTIYPALTLLKKTAGKEKAGKLIEDMEQIARLTAIQFSREYPAIHELGLDIAVDCYFRPWILEVNTKPDPCPFTKLPDQEIIGKIIRYSESYGRKYNLECIKAHKAAIAETTPQ